jgi:hypothetical protein
MLVARERPLTVRPGQPDHPGVERHQGARRKAGVREDADVDRSRWHPGRLGGAPNRGELYSRAAAGIRVVRRGLARGRVGCVLEELLTEASLDGVECREGVSPALPE